MKIHFKWNTRTNRLLRSWIRIPPGALIFVCCECCVLSGRGLCDGLITRPEESYRLWCVVVCDLETSWMRRPWPTGGCCAKKNSYKHFLEAIDTLNDKRGSQYFKHQNSQSHLMENSAWRDVTLMGTAPGDWGKPTTSSCMALSRLVRTSHERSKWY
jgi:hypothetical protein